MRCVTVEQELSKRHDGLVDATVESALGAHLAGCSACRRFAEELGRVTSEIVSISETHAGGCGAAERAVSRWRDETTFRPWPIGRLASAGALAAAVILGVLAYARHNPPMEPGVKPPQNVALRRTGGSPHESVDSAVHPEVARSGGPRSIGSTAGRQLTAPDAAPAGDPPTVDRSDVPRPVFPRDDIAYVNEDAGSIPGRWARVAPDENARLQSALMRSVRGGDDFVSVPLPRLAGLSRSNFASARRAWQAEKAIVDSRLVRKITVAVKSVSFTDLCKQWKVETGIDFSAARTVADDNVTIFCKERPLRDVMRQITQVFGFLWRRTGDEGQYQYELYQDLKGQLVEEELRNRDRNDALMALDKEMEKYRKYLNLTPEQARSMAESASPEDKHVLEQLGGTGWGAAHLYFGLSGDQMSALRSGQSVDFSSNPESGQAELPPSLRGSVLTSIPNAHVYQDSNGRRGLVMGGSPPPGTTSIPLSDLPDARANASLRLNANELGQFELEGGAGFGVTDGAGNSKTSMAGMMSDTMATGVSPSVRNPENGKANKDLARDPSLAQQILSDPESRYEIESRRNRPGGPRVTAADVLEALYKKTGMDIVSDSFLKLYDPANVAVNGKSLFEGLNRSCDAMRIRWTKGEGWLRFRSASYFNDRLKEIPNRLLARWKESRKAGGMLSLNDLMEIASLTDAQLNAGAVTEAVKAIYGLKEWDLGAGGSIRPHWRFFAAMSPALRKTTMSDKGLTFPQLPVGLQQQYVALALGRSADRIPIQLSDLATATLRVEFPYPALKKDERAVAQTAADEKRDPDVRFTYKFGNPNVANWTHEISPNGSSFGSQAANGGLQSADTVLRGARP